MLPPHARTLCFHDLGLYELLVLSLVIVPLFVFWSRRRRPVGSYLVALATLYLPVRFGLDMLRVADVRYLGLTPAQWVAGAALAALPLAALQHRRVRFAISCAVRSSDRNEDREASHATVARLSTNSFHCVVENAGHEIHLFRPAAVIRAITAAVDAARAASRLPGEGCAGLHR